MPTSFDRTREPRTREPRTEEFQHETCHDAAVPAGEPAARDRGERAGQPDWNGLRAGDRPGRRRPPWRDRHCRFTKPAGRPIRDDHRRRRLHHSVPAARPVHADLRAAGLQVRRAANARHGCRDGHPRREAAGRRRRGGRHRHRQRRRCLLRRRQRGDDVQADIDRGPAAQSWHRSDDRADARRAAHRTEQRGRSRAVDLGWHLVGEPRAGERRRRAGQRAPQRRARLHRGFAAGNDDHHVGRLGRIRPLQRRRRQRHHQVGRQPLQRHVPHQPEQRQLACADAVPRRHDLGHDRAGVRVHRRRPGVPRSAVVLHRRPLPERDA